jgi:hypothetical protein
MLLLCDVWQPICLTTCRLWAIVQNHFKRYPKSYHNPLIHEPCQIVFQSLQNPHISPLTEAIYCHHYELIGLWGDERATSNQFLTLQMFSMWNWVQINLMPRKEHEPSTWLKTFDIHHKTHNTPHCIFEKCWLMIPTFAKKNHRNSSHKTAFTSTFLEFKKMIKTFFSVWLYTIPHLIFCSKGSPWNHIGVKYKGILPLSYLLIDLENVWCRWSSNTSLYYISTLFALNENYNSTSRKSSSSKWSPTSS